MLFTYEHEISAYLAGVKDFSPGKGLIRVTLGKNLDNLYTEKKIPPDVFKNVETRIENARAYSFKEPKCKCT